MRTPREIIIRPLMTEKSMRQKDEHNTVTFRVHPDANKVEIRSAIEQVFNVKVSDVRTASFEGKLKRMGRHQGRRAERSQNVTPGWEHRRLRGTLPVRASGRHPRSG